jgi:hypothetical protein
MLRRPFARYSKMQTKVLRPHLVHDGTLPWGVAAIFKPIATSAPIQAVSRLDPQKKVATSSTFDEIRF